MADHKQAAELAQQIAQKTEVSQTTLAIPAGQDENVDRDDESLIEAINQVFALFRLNYHNQYYAAWPHAQHLGQVKRLWLEALSDFSGELILMGARLAIEGSDYLPTLNRMLESCSEALSKLGLPSAATAYEEACLAPSPKARATWSHPIVYLAGRDASWYLLANHARGEAWPVFQSHYNRWLKLALRGETLMIPEREQLEAPSETASMDLKDQKTALSALRKKTGL